MPKMEMRKKEIQKIKTERGIPYTEAKKQIQIFNSVKNTYAQVTVAKKKCALSKLKQTLHGLKNKSIPKK